MKLIEEFGLKTVLINTFLVLYCNNVFAATEQIPIDRTITRLQTYEDEAIITFTPSFSNNQGCPTVSTIEVIIDLSSGKGKAMYSTALAAASAGKTVGMGLNGCHSGFPLIYRIDVDY